MLNTCFTDNDSASGGGAGSQQHETTKLKQLIKILRKPELSQKIKDVEGEACAMFIRSKVPVHEWSDNCISSEQVQEEVTIFTMTRVVV